MSDFDSYLQLFRKAKKETTLAVMVESQADKLRVTFNPSIRSYNRASQDFRELDNTQAADMFKAAHEREQEIQRSQVPSLNW